MHSASLQPQEPLHGRRGDLSIDLGLIMNALLRRWSLIAGMALLGLLLAMLYIAVRTPTYTASAQLQLNSSDQQLLAGDATGPMRNDEAALAKSELDVIGSTTIARRIVQRLDLTHDAEFSPEAGDRGPVRYLIQSIKSLFSAKNEADTAERTLIQTTGNVLDNLDVAMAPGSYTVSVSFESESPRKAQQIANAFVEEYLNYQIESRYEASQRAGKWMAASVEELRQKVIASEKAVQTFTEKHNLFSTNGRTLNDQQIEQLSGQLVGAQSALAQAQSRLTSVQQMRRSGSIDAAPEVLNSALIQGLRQQEALLSQQRSELLSQFGPKHPRTNSVNGEIEELERKISKEIDKIVRGLANQASAAQERLSMARSQLDKVRSSSNVDRRLDAQLNDLNREAVSNRTLYESMLASMKQTGEAGNMQKVNARVIAMADLPLEKSHPKTTLALLAGLMAGGLIGAGLALLLEHLNQGFLTLESIEDRLGVPGLALLPEASKKSIFEDATMASSSLHSRALRRIGSVLPVSDRGATTFLIASAVPEEGKGWFSTSLARSLARDGKRVLLIDCDFHSPQRSLHSDASEATLNDYLSGVARVEQIIQKDTLSNMSLISSRPDLSQDAALRSERMQQLIVAVRDMFDVILLDTPPLLGMQDAVTLSAYADQAIFLIRWSRTPREVVETALRLFQQIRIPIFGVVLSRVELGYFKRREFGRKQFYDSFNRYYHA